MTLDADVVNARAWTVVEYDNKVLAHRITLTEALKLALETMAAINGWNGSGRYWPLFMIAPAPLTAAAAEEEDEDDDDEGDEDDEDEDDSANWTPIEGGLYRKNSPREALRARGKVIDVRDVVAADPSLDIGGAAESIYAPFRNIDLCSVAYRDMGPLFNWPKGRVNHMAALDPAIERHVRERYAADLAAGTPVSVVFERTRLTHLDELHLWVFRQIFYFHASAPGRYKEPSEVYGFSSSPFRDHVVLAWGCAPHAHDMAWGIAYGIDVDLPVQPDARPAPRDVEIHLEPRFVEQIGALLGNAKPGRNVMNEEDVALMIAGKKRRAKTGTAKKAAAKKTAGKTAAKKTAAKKTSVKKAAAKRAGGTPPKKAAAKKTTAKKTTAKKGPARKAPAKKTTKKATAGKSPAKG